MSYAKGKNFNVVFLPLRYSAGDTYCGSGLVLLGPPGNCKLYEPKIFSGDNDNLMTEFWGYIHKRNQAQGEPKISSSIII